MRMLNKNYYYYAKYVFILASIICIYAILPNLNTQEKYSRTKPANVKDKHLKYILQWTSSKNAPFDAFEKGRLSFTKNNCRHTNCFVTDDRNYLTDTTDFDAVMFNGKDVVYMAPKDLPKMRNMRQKYIFAALESAHYYPACNSILDGYFNWTWTYKLDSDFRWSYITIYNLNGTIVGPEINMRWPKLNPVSEDLKFKLRSKHKAAAWFASNCRSLSKREPFAEAVREELMEYGWSLDVFGECGRYQCPRAMEDECFKMLELEYFFYLSFENSFSEDYVTEKLLTALNNYAVPVVYGGANYSRFLPPGSYLNARELGVKKLAEYIDKIIKNQSLYLDFHRWRNHFIYKDTGNNVDMCNLCEMLNNEDKMSKFSVHENFRNWWNGKPLKDACYSYIGWLLWGE